MLCPNASSFIQDYLLWLEGPISTISRELPRRTTQEQYPLDPSKCSRDKNFNQKLNDLDLKVTEVGQEFTAQTSKYNAPVICIHAPPRAGDSGDSVGLKCQVLTSDESRQCRECAGVLMSRQYTVTLFQIR